MRLYGRDRSDEQVRPRAKSLIEQWILDARNPATDARRKELSRAAVELIVASILERPAARNGASRNN